MQLAAWQFSTREINIRSHTLSPRLKQWVRIISFENTCPENNKISVQTAVHLIKDPSVRQSEKQVHVTLAYLVFWQKQSKEPSGFLHNWLLVT